MIKCQRFFTRFASVAALFLLAGCQHAVILNPKGLIATSEKNLMLAALGLMMLIVIPVILLTLFIARRYRASNTTAKYTPNWAHSNALEALWWAIPMVIIVILGTITWISTHRLDPYRPLANEKTRPLTIEAVALQWRWLFIYPEQKIATIDYVQFPVNRPVNFLITADAPMNSFQIPQLGGQIYAMAGMQTKLHLIANEKGNYQGRSVSFSGDGFSGMKFVAHVDTNEQFSRWVKKVKHSSDSLTLAGYEKLDKPTKDASVHYFSSIDRTLYAYILNKYKAPQPVALNKSTAHSLQQQRMTKQSKS